MKDEEGGCKVNQARPVAGKVALTTAPLSTHRHNLKIASSIEKL